MKSYTITVNGVAYDVTVEEGAGNGAAPAAAPKAAPKSSTKGCTCSSSGTCGSNTGRFCCK